LERWAEIVCTVVYLKNQSPTRSLKNKTPYEALHGTKPDLSHLRAIRTKAFAHVPKKKTKKMDFRSEASGILVGCGGSNQYRIWDPIANKILVSASVRFVGDRKKVKEKDAGTSGSREPIIHDEIVVMPEPKAFPSVDEMDGEDEEEEGEEEDDPEVEDDPDDPDDDLATISTSAEQRQPSNEPETFASAPSSTRRLPTCEESPPPEPRAQCIRKAPEKFDPGSYVSAEKEAESQSYQSHIA
jgi:hypothetical protein